MMVNGQEYKICIDRDEEIMDVVDRLRRTPVRDVILVVPQHAMLLQSGVNLKILAYEAHQMSKKITIMTNDEDGIALAQRAKIPTEQYRGDDVPQKTAFVQPSHTELPLRRSITHDIAARHLQQPDTQDHGRSGSLQQTPQQDTQQRHSAPSHAMPQGVRATQQFVRPSQKPLSNPSASVKGSQPQHRVATQLQQSPSSAQRVTARKEDRRAMQPPSAARMRASQESLRGDSGPKLQHVQRGTSAARAPQHGDSEKHIASRKPRIVAIGLVVAAVVVLGLVTLMIFLPLSHITVHPRHATIDDRIDITARAEQQGGDAERRIIPARVIDRDVTFTKTFAATGRGDAGAQKAQGKITITNTDSTAQPLVATTRFVAEDGTLFRLANAVTVPAARNGEPGTVEALVIADKAGADGNIAPTTFHVPGLSGTAKKDKVSAKSDAPMTGGGSGGSDIALVTQDDLAAAKASTEQETAADVESQITALLRPDVEILLPTALRMTQKQSEADVAVGTAQPEFHYTTTTHVRAIVFSQDDVHAVLQSIFAEQLASYGVVDAQLSVTYDDGDADFDASNVKVGVHVTLDTVAHVDHDAFKKEIIGQKHDALRDIIERNHMTGIEKITINRVIPQFPAFIANRVSPIGLMTTVSVEKAH